MVLSTKEYKLAVKFDKDSDNIDDSFFKVVNSQVTKKG